MSTSANVAARSAISSLDSAGCPMAVVASTVKITAIICCSRYNAAICSTVGARSPPVLKYAEDAASSSSSIE